ncbi:protein-L-isoaspartate O-methyltransferase [Saccharomonospora viridis]|uniref:Protein-L-isoaspartate O-methyltransferase n=1 Tax=Saccharomonospora viridis TaxID=1852 RepID=A0A837DBQ0_9PSEU|nr:protein-L-isoaspartate O-methyltransferase [Saccharomonospora viridis]
MTTTCSTSTADAASVLREAMVRELREWGAIRSEPVEQAALTVPRHCSRRASR